MLYRVLAAASAVLCSASLALAEWPVGDMNRQIDQTNVYVNDGCSGTLIDIENRFVLTASHCVDAQYKTVIREEVAADGTVTKKEVRIMVPGHVRMPVFDGAHQIGETIYNTTLVSVDRGRDLALVQIIIKDIPNTQFSPIACLNPVRGETAYVVGNPFGALFATVGVGIVSSVARDYQTLGWVDGVDKRGTESLMQISAGVIGGNSGGAVYNVRGELIGVPVVAANGYETIGFAVSLEDIKEFLKGTPAKSLLDRCSQEPGRA